MDSSHYEHCPAFITALEQDGFFIKIYAQIPSDAGVSGRELASRIEQISGHLRRVKGCDSVSPGQLAFARIDDNFHRARVLSDGVDGRVLVKFIDYGHEEWIQLQDLISVNPPLSDVLTTVRPLADEFLLDGVILHRPLASDEILQLSEKIVFQTLSSRIRRIHPDVSLIELATANTPGGRRENLRNLIVEAGFGKKVSVEDIAKCLRIKIPTRSEEVPVVAMQPARQFGNLPSYTIPPPNLQMIPPPQNVGSPPMTTMNSVNTRLMRFKKDAALEMNGTGSANAYQQVASPPPLADRKQYADGRTCTTAPSLLVNSTHNVYISHVEDGPYLFFIQLKNSVEEVLPKLKNILARYQSAPVNSPLLPGSIVMVKSSDETLRRGVVMNMLPQTCNVYYIDFGNSEDRPYSDLFQLPNTAVDLSPAMAIQFCLADVKSIKITEANKDYFSRLLLGKQVFIRVTERESNSPFQFCDIIWEGRNVREMLMNLNSPMQYMCQYPPRERETSVSVVYTDGPNQFYVQYRSELSVVSQIQESLAAYCSEQPRITDLSVVNIGSPVASIFPDDQRWYRALIMGMDSNKINVFYIDYGNRAEVGPNQICLLTRDLVNKWKAQAVECCLIGFDTVSPDVHIADQMEETVLGRTYTLRLHSILSGFRLSVDLIDEQGNSIAAKMKAILEERQKTHPPPSSHSSEKKKFHEEDRLSQHSNDSGSSGKKNKFRPPLRADREKERGNKFEKRAERNKFEERPSPHYQHDDRSGSAGFKQKDDSRSDWRKSTKKPYMDQESEWESPVSKPESYWNEKQDSGSGFKKSDWRSGDKPAWGGDGSNRGRFNSDKGERGDKGDWNDRGNSRDGERKGGFNRFERKQFTNDEDGSPGDNWGSKDKKFGGRGEREGKFGERDNKFGDRDSKFGDRDNKFGDRGYRSDDRSSKFGGERGSRFGGRDKPGFRDNQKSRWNNDDQTQSKPQTTADDDEWGEEVTAPPAPSVTISEYPHQRIVVGQEYRVLFVGMESPNNVYVQISGCDPVLDRIRASVDADATATSRPISPSKVVLGMPVLARFVEDRLLYRALIKSTAKLASGQVDILFVDFGNSAVNALSEVFTISSELMTEPVQAIHVIITDIPDNFPGDVASCQGYFEEVEYFTLKPSSNNVMNLAQVVEGTLIRPDGRSVAESLREGHQGGTMASAQEPSIEQPAVGIPSAKIDAVVKTSLKPGYWVERLDLLVGQTLRAKVTLGVEDHSYFIKITDTLDLIVLAQSEQPIPPNVLKPGEEVIVKVNSLAENRLRAHFYNRDGHSLSGGTAIDPICPMPIVARRGLYTISHKEGERLFLHSVDSTDQLSDLLELLFEKYETSTGSPNDAFAVNDLCVAKSFDGNWYRAKIVSVVGNTCTVLYLDYGNSEHIERENLRKLVHPFFTPAMCVGVSLPLKYLNVVEDSPVVFDTLEGETLECTFIKQEAQVWYVDVCKAGAIENLALQWIAANQAEPSGVVSANPKRREPGWNLKKHDVISVVVTHADSPSAFFAQLSEDLAEINELQSKLEELPDSGDLGEVFAAKYAEDGVWYRAAVLGDQVRFIDYGNADSASERKKLPDDLINSYPIKGYAMPLAMKIKPKGDDWTEEGIAAFDAFLDHDDLTAVIISVDFETVVDLRCGNVSLTRSLVDGGHADFVSTQYKNVGAIVLDSEIPVGTLPATVVSANSMGDFYIQEESKVEVLDKLASILENAESFVEIKNPSVGDFIAAKFIDDSNWYRATVVSDDPTEVLFVDYGNVSPASEFRALTPELVALPKMAWHCTVEVDESPEANGKFLALVDEGAVFEVTVNGLKEDKLVVKVRHNGANVFQEPTVPVQAAPVSESVLPETPVPVQPPESTCVAVMPDQPLPPAIGKSLYKNCVLCHSNGPYDFYLQTDDDQITIEEVANALFEAGTFTKVDDVKKGDFVIAQFTEDDAYYRALVTEVQPEVVVHFIDYGNSCPATVFHELPTKLKEVPTLAVRCSLQSPIGGWSVDAIDKFSELLNAETKSIDLKIITRGDPNIVDVEINGASITKLLAPDAKFESEPVHETDNQKADIADLVQTKLEISDSKDCQVQESTTISISFAVSPCEFYCQEDAAKVTEIAERLASADAFAPIEKYEIGQLICAQYPEDELWYRAKVVTVEPTTVFFVDYGNDSEVTNVRTLPDDLAKIPPLCFKACLKPQDQPWTEEENDKFLEVACNGDFTCTVIQKTQDSAVVQLSSADISDMITFLGRSCSERTTNSDYCTPQSTLSPIGDDDSAQSTELLASVVDALQINCDLQDALDAHLAVKDLITRTAIRAVSANAKKVEETPSEIEIHDSDAPGSVLVDTVASEGKNAQTPDLPSDSNDGPGGIRRDSLYIDNSTCDQPQTSIIANESCISIPEIVVEDMSEPTQPQDFKETDTSCEHTMRLDRVVFIAEEDVCSKEEQTVKQYFKPLRLTETVISAMESWKIPGESEPSPSTNFADESPEEKQTNESIDVAVKSTAFSLRGSSSSLNSLDGEASTKTKSIEDESCCSSCGGERSRSPSPSRIGAFAGRMLSPVKFAAAGVASGVGTVASGVTSGVGTVASGVTSGVGTVATGVATGAGVLASGVVTGAGAVASGVGTVASGVTSGVGTVASGVATGAGALASGVVTGAGAVASGVSTAASGVTSGVVNGAEAVATGVGTAASGITTGVVNGAEAVATGVGAAASGVTSGVVAVVSGVVNGAEAMKTGVVTKAGTVVSSVVGGTGTVVSELKKASVVAKGIGDVGAGRSCQPLVPALAMGGSFVLGTGIGFTLGVGYASVRTKSSSSLNKVHKSRDLLDPKWSFYGYLDLKKVSSAAGDLALPSNWEALKKLSPQSVRTYEDLGIVNSEAKPSTEGFPRRKSGDFLSTGSDEINVLPEPRRSMTLETQTDSERGKFGEVPTMLVSTEMEPDGAASIVCQSWQMEASAPREPLREERSRQRNSPSARAKEIGKAKAAAGEVDKRNGSSTTEIGKAEAAAGEVDKRNGSSTTEANKKQQRPIKTLAEIKANAKSRIFSTSSASLKDPSVEKKLDEKKPPIYRTPPKTPVLKKKSEPKSTPASTHSTPVSSRDTKQDLKIVPGSVSGYL